MFKSRLSVKFFTLIVVLLLLQIPLNMIKEQISDREYTRESVVSEISKSWGSAQHVIGPIIMVPYTTIRVDDVWDGNTKSYRQSRTVVHSHKLLMPEVSRIDGQVHVTTRKRSIYGAPVYNAQLRLSGHFDLSELHDIEGTLGIPSLVVLMSDLSGVLSIPSLDVEQTKLTFQEGGYKGINGIRTTLDHWQDQQSYDIALDLKGSNQISVYPLAKNNEVNLQSNWLHPSFNGQFLPESHQIAEDGFIANWRTTSLASNASVLLEQCKSGHCSDLMSAGFGVTFFEPVNHYTQSERAAKYAVLLIVTTFAMFFVLEALKTVPVHPVQYMLIGLSLTIFNLLLVALTEHFNFAVSYLISSLACLGLLGAYAYHILQRRGLLLGFMALLVVIYTLMYFILLSEDYAFLMGSAFLFSILGTLMIATRKVNWYEVGALSSVAKQRAEILKQPSEDELNAE